jgi:prepilin peptidase CpaA
MFVSASAAMWFLPFVLPICFYVAFTDMREMRITNQAVLALVAVYAIVGLIALPVWGDDWSTGGIGPVVLSLPDYVWGFVRLAIVLVLGILFNAAGAMGAGDAKFMAAAAPYIALQDLRVLILILCANMLAAVTTHWIAKHTALRRAAPHWKSWTVGNKKFPMGLSLAGTLAIYLILGSIYGS